MKTNDEWIDSLNIPDQEKAVLKILHRLDDMSNNDLARIEDALNGYEWPDDLPGKPEGWEKMNFDEKDPWVGPIRHSIEGQLGQKALLRYHHKVNLGKTDQEFEDWWDSRRWEEMQKAFNKGYDGRQSCNDEREYRGFSQEKILPLLLGFIFGSLFSDFIVLLLKIIGVLQV